MFLIAIFFILKTTGTRTAVNSTMHVILTQTIRTFLAKAIGVSFAIASGLFAGMHHFTKTNGYFHLFF